MRGGFLCDEMGMGVSCPVIGCDWYLLGVGVIVGVAQVALIGESLRSKGEEAGER